jgi:hypothetical protein
MSRLTCVVLAPLALLLTIGAASASTVFDVSGSAFIQPGSTWTPGTPDITVAGALYNGVYSIDQSSSTNYFQVAGPDYLIIPDFAYSSFSTFSGGVFHDAFFFLDTVDGTFSVTFTPETAATPLPAALPLFATGLGALGLLGWRRKRKNVALAA